MFGGGCKEGPEDPFKDHGIKTDGVWECEGGRVGGDLPGESIKM